MNKKTSKKKEITIDDLAMMVQGGFEDITVKMATKDDVNKRFDSVDKRFDAIDTRLDRIEYLLVRGLSNRVEILEDKMRMVQTSLARKK